MPVYTYRCSGCQATQTQTIPIQDADRFKAVCKCGAEMKRIVSVPAVAFRGSGWGREAR